LHWRIHSDLVLAFLGNQVKADFARETIELMKESLSRNRDSGLAVHCRQYLFRFISAAYDSKADLERHRIELKFRLAEADIATAKREGLEAFQKNKEVYHIESTCLGINVIS